METIIETQHHQVAEITLSYKSNVEPSLRPKISGRVPSLCRLCFSQRPSVRQWSLFPFAESLVLLVHDIHDLVSAQVQSKPPGVYKFSFVTTCRVEQIVFLIYLFPSKVNE